MSINIPKPRTIAVVGTDTGVGKTLVAAALLRFFKDRGGVIPFKPAETGCAQDSPPDGIFLSTCAGLTPNRLEDVVPFRYALPASPLTASLEEQRPIHLSAVIDHHARLAQGPNKWIVLEGAGGLLVPFGTHWTFADLLEKLRPTIVLVAKTSLGTMNHTLLTVSELRHRNLPIAGLVFNQISRHPGPEEAQTPDIISHFAQIPVLGILPHLTKNQLTEPIQAAQLALSALEQGLVSAFFP